MIQIANAPCSWGALEFELEGESLGYQQVLNEMVETGYAGTELGDWGFMPTDPAELKMVLQNKDLQLLGAFVPVALADRSAHGAGTRLALKTAKLMYDAGYKEAFIVLADENGSVEERTRNAGRITPAMGLSPAKWEIFSEGAESVARTARFFTTTAAAMWKRPGRSPPSWSIPIRNCWDSVSTWVTMLSEEAIRWRLWKRIMTGSGMCISRTLIP